MTKKLICAVSAKGGVGKTTFSRLLTDFYKLNGVDADIYDGDGQVGGLARVYHDDNVKFYDLRKDVERDTLLNSIMSDKDVIFHDLPGGSRFEISKIVDNGDGEDVTGFLDALSDNNVELVLIHLIDSEIESSQSVSHYMKAFGTDNVKHIACLNYKNALSDADFPYWFGQNGKFGKGRAALLESGGKEFIMPALRSGVSAKVNANRLKYRDALKSSELTIAERGQLSKFIKSFNENIKAVDDVIM